MNAPDIEDIKARYQAALDAKPSKGDYTDAGIAALTDVVQAVIDEHVTPRAQRLDVIHQLAQGIADAYGDAWPHIGGCQGDGADGCPLCRILALSRGV